MVNSVFIENKKFVNQWINLNPNFKGLEFYDNILKYGEIEIDLKSFLVSELLKNTYFNNNIYTMKINEFLKIINLHIESISILNPKDDEEIAQTEEYIKHVKINSLGRAMIITNEDVIEIMDIGAIEVLSKYSSLTTKYDYFVPLNELFILLQKAEKQKSPEISTINFFTLLHKDGELNLAEYNYIKYISNFIFSLNDNEEKIIDKARYLLDIYMIEMNRLKCVENLTNAQKYALKLYNEYIKILETELKKNEEANYSSSKNYGYSTFWMIFASVISTIITIIFLYYI